METEPMVNSPSFVMVMVKLILLPPMIGPWPGSNVFSRARSTTQESKIPICCKQLALFPQASVALQVRLIKNDPPQVPGVMRSEKVNTGVPVQLSAEVGDPVLAGNVLSRVESVTSFGQEMV